MPIYEYACRSCGRRVDVIHGINDPGPTACEVCGGPMAKQLSTPAIVFKGSGWAKKDARETSTAKADRAEEKPITPATAGGATTAENKAGSGDGASGKPSDSKGSPAPERTGDSGSSGSESKAGSSRSDSAG